MTMQYGYYPYYSTGNAQQAQQLSSYAVVPYQNIAPTQNPQYYTSQQQQQQQQQQASFSSLSSDNDVQYNQVPVASNWLNQGTNYNPYAQGQYNSVVSQNYNSITPTTQQPGYTTPYHQYAADTVSQKTYTEQSSKSGKSGKMMTDYEAMGASSRASLQLTSQVLNEDLNQLTPQIEAAYEAASGKRRQPVIKRQVITMPGEPGRVKQVVRRLPTPTPDIIERVFIVKPQRDTINLVIERPTTPPVMYKDKTVYGKSRRPIINPKVVTVHPSSYLPGIEGNYQSGIINQQIEQNYQHNNMQSIDYTTTLGQQQGTPELPTSYLIAPLNVYNENNSNNAVVQSFVTQTGQNMGENQSMGQNSRQPTFSTNVLQPYNPPMLDQYNTTQPQQQQQATQPAYQYQPMPNYY